MKVLQILLLILLISSICNAQNATLSGTIYDQQGSVIPNTKIILKDSKNNQTETVSDERGNYTINLNAGIYDITIIANGFEPFRLKSFRIVSAYKDKMNLDISLQGKLICSLEDSEKPKLINKKKFIKRKKNK